MSELISVIVPVYNVENYLQECLGSILSQTYQHLEIILVDDGSTDGSGQICEDYASRDSRIRVYHQVNTGVSAARNLALSQVTGSYVTIVDADDGIHETFIQDLYDNLKAHQADIAVSNYYKYSEFDGRFYFHNLDRDDLVEVLTPQGCMDYQCDIKDYIGMAFIPVLGKLYRTDLFDGICFPIESLIDDEMVTHKLYLKSERVVLVNKNAYFYRVRPGSIMTTDRHYDRQIADSLRAFEIKLTDMLLAGLETDLMVRRFVGILKLFEKTLDLKGQGVLDNPLYQQVTQKLELFHRYQDTN